MPHYSVEFVLPHPMPNKFTSLIGEQRARVSQLMNQGIILTYSLAADYSKIWAVVEGENEEFVEEIIGSLPLSVYMYYEIKKLAFHHSIYGFLPQISLN